MLPASIHTTSRYCTFPAFLYFPLAQVCATRSIRLYMPVADSLLVLNALAAWRTAERLCGTRWCIALTDAPVRATSCGSHVVHRRSYIVHVVPAARLVHHDHLITPRTVFSNEASHGAPTRHTTKRDGVTLLPSCPRRIQQALSPWLRRETRWTARFMLQKLRESSDRGPNRAILQSLQRNCIPFCMLRNRLLSI